MASGLDSLSISISASTKTARKNIDDLSLSLNKLGSTLSNNINATKLNSVAESFNKLASATEKFGKSTSAINKLPALTKSLSDMATALSGAPQISHQVIDLANSLSKLGENGANLREASKGVAETMSAMQQSGTPSTDSASSLEDIKNSIDDLVNKKEKADSLANTIARINRAFSETKALLGRIGSTFRKVGGKIKSFFADQEKGFKKGLMFVLKYGLGVRSLYVLWKKLRSAVEDGNKNLSKFSSNFNSQMSAMKSGLYVLSNSLAVAFAPVILAIGDAVSRVLRKIAQAFNTIARFLATLFGQANVIQINTDFMYDYADSLDNASKSAKKFIAPFDEINQRQEKSSSSSSGINNAGLFNEIPTGSNFESLKNRILEAWENSDFTELGQELGNMIIEGLYSIPWGSIQETASQIGSSLATLLLGLLTAQWEDHTLGDSIGYTIGNTIQTGIEFAHSLVMRFTEGEDGQSGWVLLGQNIADVINTGFAQINWSMLGETIFNWVHGWLTTITTAIQDTDWYAIGQDIATMLSEIDWEQLIIDFTTLASTIWEAIKEAIKGWQETDPESFGIVGKIVGVIGAIKFFDLLSRIMTGTSLGTFVVRSIADTIKQKLTITTLTTALGGTGAFSGTLIGSIASVLGATVVGALITVPIALTFTYLWTHSNAERETASRIGERGATTFTTGGAMANNDFTALQTVIGYFRDLKQASSEADTSVGELNTTLSENTPTATNTAVTQGQAYQQFFTETLPTKVSTAKDKIGTSWNSVSTSTSEKWRDIKETVATQTDNLKSRTETDIDRLKTNISTKWNNMETTASAKWRSIKETVQTQAGNLKERTETDIETLKTNLSNKWDSIKSTAETKWGNIKSTISTAIDGIKGLMNFTWSFPTPTVQLPHFNIEFETRSILGHDVDVPSISVEYYANGGLIPNGLGSLFVAGENGAEIVSQGTHGTGVMNESQMASAIKQAVIEGMMEVAMASSSDNSNSGSVEIPIYLDGRELARSTVNNMEAMIRGGQLRPSFI